jgi:putative spermidine/putrescine transport system permease protein
MAGFALALGALLQYSLLEFIPGSLRTGGLTIRNFQQVVAPQYLRAIWETAVLSAATTVLTLLASYPVAYALARARSAGLRSLLLVLTLAPFFTGAIVRTYAWILVLGNSGFINSLLIKARLLETPYQMLFTTKGVLIGLVHFSMPVMILILAAALSHIDPAYERAAASLGANPASVFLRVTLPLSLPGVISGSVVVFAWTFSAFPTPELLGGGRVKMIANVVKDLALDSFNWPGSAAFAVVALSVTFALLAVVARSLERLRFGRHA